MSLSRFEEAVEHRRSADGSPAEAGEYGGEVVAAVEAVFEFGQIARNVLVTDRPIGTDDLVAQRGVDPVEGRREDRLAAGAGADRLVGTAGRGDAAKARQTIATTAQPASRLRLAKTSISVRRKPRPRRSLRRTSPILRSRKTGPNRELMIL
jgi:hypothetical protein